MTLLVQTPLFPYMYADQHKCVMQVEKAPTVVKAGLKKEEAEELKKKLEAGTCSCSIYDICCQAPANAISTESSRAVSHADMCYRNLKSDAS